MMVYIVFNLVERSAITSHLSLLRSQFFSHLSGDPTFVSSNAEFQSAAAVVSTEKVSTKYRETWKSLPLFKAPISAFKLKNLFYGTIINGH